MLTRETVSNYARKYNLEEQLSEAVNAAIKSASPDPLGFISSKLAAMSASLGSSAVDYSAVREELKLIMDNPSWDDGSQAPVFSRLAWHSSGTYDKVSATGGSNGAGMRLPIEGADPENTGLATARAFLEPVKRRFPGISYSDLWVLAAYVGIEHTGGPSIKFVPGRADYEDESASTYPGRPIFTPVADAHY